GEPIRQVRGSLNQVGFAGVDSEGELKRSIRSVGRRSQVDRRLEQVAEIVRARRVLQERTHSENLLQSAERRSVIKTAGAEVTIPLGQGRKHDHANRPVQATSSAFVPGDEQRPVVCPSWRVENSGKLR